MEFPHLDMIDVACNISDVKNTYWKSSQEVFCKVRKIIIKEVNKNLRQNF